jgi:hypothetical protein
MRDSADTTAHTTHARTHAHRYVHCIDVTQVPGGQISTATFLYYHVIYRVHLHLHYHHHHIHHHHHFVYRYVATCSRYPRACPLPPMVVVCRSHLCKVRLWVADACGVCGGRGGVSGGVLSFCSHQLCTGIGPRTHPHIRTRTHVRMHSRTDHVVRLSTIDASSRQSCPRWWPVTCFADISSLPPEA